MASLPTDQLQWRERAENDEAAPAEGTLNPHHRLWTAAELASLGTMPDQDRAARLGRPGQSVRELRKALGIAAPERKPWTAEEDAVLFDGTAKQVAERLRRNDLRA